MPPTFVKTESEVIGVPGKLIWQNAIVDADSGRYKQHELPQLLFAFKTPTVRNALLTAPYMHNGVYPTLDEVVEFYNRGGGAGIGIDLSNQTLPVDSLRLSPDEKRKLISFIESLTDSNAVKTNAP